MTQIQYLPRSNRFRVGNIHGHSVAQVRTRTVTESQLRAIGDCSINDVIRHAVNNPAVAYRIGAR